MPISAFELHACGRRRRLWLLAAATAASLASIGGYARAQNYPWCSNFADGAGTNCGFSTEEQCRAAIMGSGGYCDRNTQFRAPSLTAPAQRRALRHRFPSRS